MEVVVMQINVIGDSLSESEVNRYASILKEKYHNRVIKQLDITVDGDYVDIKTTFDEQPFFRLRRITGYLTDSLDRWCNGKRAEEKDRVKHSVTE